MQNEDQFNDNLISIKGSQTAQRKHQIRGMLIGAAVGGLEYLREICRHSSK